MKLFKNKFFTSTFILMLSGLSTKVLGLIIKIIFTRIVGNTTISLYTIVMPTYSLLLTIGTFAMPTTIAKLIAPSIFKKYEEGDISAIKEYLQSTQEGNLKDALLAIGIKNNKEGIEVLFKNLQEEEMLSREQNEKSDG